MNKSHTIALKLVDKEGSLIDKVQVAPTATIKALKETIFATTKAKIPPSRQRISTNLKGQRGTSIALEEKGTIEEYGLGDDDCIVIRDLGPQVSWTSVFVLEYAGPLIIHHLYFHSKYPTLSFAQTLGYMCIMFHFLKREYETFFVHRFSHATMPFQNLIKNCLHYWLLGGFGIAWFLYRPTYVAPSQSVVLISAAVFLVLPILSLAWHI